MDLIISYIQDWVVLADYKLVWKLRCQIARYTQIDRVLHKQGYTLPFLLCLNDEEADYVLRKIH